jgi:hypothetical protein
LTFGVRMEIGGLSLDRKYTGNRFLTQDPYPI